MTDKKVIDIYSKKPIKNSRSVIVDVFSKLIDEENTKHPAQFSTQQSAPKETPNTNERLVNNGDKNINIIIYNPISYITIIAAISLAVFFSVQYIQP